MVIPEGIINTSSALMVSGCFLQDAGYSQVDEQGQWTLVAIEI